MTKPIPTFRTSLPSPSHPLLTLLLALLLLPGLTAAAEGAAAAPSAQRVVEALEAAREAAGGYHLRVHCTEDDSRRNLQVFPSGVAIWNGDTQVTLDEPTRRALVATLLEKGFASMAESYGGKRMPEAKGETDGGGTAGAAAEGEPAGGGGMAAAERPRPEESVEAAALRVTCHVTFEGDGITKTTVQEYQGEQEPAVFALAGALLDRVEPLAAKGVSAGDLGDALAKLSAGELAPETFTLRFVQQPGEGTGEAAGGVGTIARVEGSTLTTRPYAPGRELGEPEARDLDEAAFAALVKALRDAGFATLPVNLWSPTPVELEVTVLGHRKAILARPFQGREAQEPEARSRFDKLVSHLEAGLLGEDPAESGETTTERGR